jgi:UDPglucose 6-dehydrogenase
MNVLIIGYGVVGKAVASIFKKKEITIVDPKYTKNKISDFKDKKFDVVFVCVDTPHKDKFKLLDRILNECNLYLKKNIICCKSTSSPIFYKLAVKKYSHINILFYPEFLSHWSNKKDFKNQEYVILGGKKNISIQMYNILKQRLKKLKDVYYTTIEAAAYVKYCANYFFILKVTFANDIYILHKKLKMKESFNRLTDILGTDKRIGKSHLQVPGRDKMYGWGGHCFPKDIKELIDFSNSPLASFVFNLNKTHRKHKEKIYSGSKLFCFK